ncbi:MAG: hypothetical protein HWD85_10645 [Flavobacteriaceae bacterium]|nr:hypothetical protein [Flavobacteriaceae bacterium]
MKKGFILIMVTLIISCNTVMKKNKCISKVYDTSLIQKYLVVTDSCKTFEGYNNISYYNNSRLVMSGYSERNFKQGEWSFYNLKKEIIKGSFKNSQPIGEWKFIDIGNISWKNYQNLEKGYKFSFPKKWESSAFVDGNMIGVSNSSNQSEQDFFVSITSGEINELNLSLEDYIKSLHNRFNDNKDVKNLKQKKIYVEGLKDAYEFKYDTKNMGIELSSNEMIYISNDRIYAVSVIIRKGTSYDYSILKEIIMTSFKISKG